VAVIAVALQLLLTPRFGVTGAAGGTALTYLSLFVVIRTISQRLYPMVTRCRDFLIVAGSASATLLAGLSIMNAYTSLWTSLAVSVFGVAGCGLLFLRTGVIDIDDVRSVVSRVGIRLGARQLEKGGA
jgi:O-antigen/teichoic acid export membrane protein